MEKEKSNARIFGYVRVSSKDQHVDRQVIAMKERFQIPTKDIFVDKQSGKDFERPAYQKLLRKLKEGDLLVIQSIDRLGRNYDEIITQWRAITKEIKADIVVLDMALLDTRREKDLLGSFISDLVLQILSYFAQSERESIKQRQADGIKAAIARGVTFGRPALEKPDMFYELHQKYILKEISSREAAKMLNISHQTFIRWSKDLLK